jgi:hypothetical protein
MSKSRIEPVMWTASVWTPGSWDTERTIHQLATKLHVDIYWSVKRWLFLQRVSFVVSGPRAQVAWFKRKLRKAYGVMLRCSI